MMNMSKPLTGIAYNIYAPVAGHDSERISEESVEEAAQDVYRAITHLDFPVTLFPMRRSMRELLRRIKASKCDVLINLCEGFRGIPGLEANIAALYELENISFTGNTSRTLSLCQDKFRTKAVLSAFGLPTARSILAIHADQVKDLSFPMIVKPNAEDASLGIYGNSIVYDNLSLARQIEKTISVYAQPALVEEYIEGREFNVAVYDAGEPQALPVSEIDFSNMPADQPHICGYEAKWFEEHELYNSSVPVCPARLDTVTTTLLQKMASDAYVALGCRDYARVDFRMDSKQQIFILEVNPNPDISNNAGFSRALNAAGIEYHTFWKTIISETLNRRGCL